MPVNIDWNFISSLEGGQKLVGYVPVVARSHSGVTIATGFDLGQWHEWELLRRLNLPLILVAKLRPYLGLKLQDAERKLEQLPLTVTKEEADQMDKAVKRRMLEITESRYNAVPPSPELYKNRVAKFEDLHPIPQTVIYSGVYNLGWNKAKYPRWTYCVVANDWIGLYKELMNFGHKAKGLTNRRIAEATYLRPYLTVLGKPIPDAA